MEGWKKGTPPAKEGGCNNIPPAAECELALKMDGAPKAL